MIDPGHGGVDPGAIGSAMKILEKNVALRTGLALRNRLEATGRYRVIMTRARRSDRATARSPEDRRESGGELFVSLHADSLVQAPHIRGASVYTLSERASNEEAARLARKENRADILAGIDLSNQEDIVTEILIDLAQRDANNRSIELAEALVRSWATPPEWPGGAVRRPASWCSSRPTCPRSWWSSATCPMRPMRRPWRMMAHVAALADAVARAIDVHFGVGPS